MPTVESISSGPISSGRRKEPKHILVALGVALAIVVIAWWIGGRQNFGAVGRGGINQQLLPKVGEAAPDFAVFDMSGREVHLSDYRGQPIWLTFWGSWCPPCRAEMPDIETAFREVGPKGVTLLAVSLDESASAAESFAARNHASFTVLSDPSRSGSGRAYPILNFPTHIFIDRAGIIQKIVLAPMNVDEAVDNATRLASDSL